MTELRKCFDIEIQRDTHFFKSFTLFTNKYIKEKNYAAFYPRNNDIETNKIFATTMLGGLNAKVVEDFDYSVHLIWPYPERRPQYTRKIHIPGEDVRPAIQRLFDLNKMRATDRNIVEQPLRKLENCLDFTSRIGPYITSAQRECIEDFITPHLEVLREKMRLWEMREASKKASIVVNGYVDPERSFNSVMRNTFMNQYPLMGTSDTNPNVRVINRDWSTEEQDEILDALFIVGKVLSGNANLEGVLLKSSETVPDLEKQNEVVMDLIVSGS